MSSNHKSRARRNPPKRDVPNSFAELASANSNKQDSFDRNRAFVLLRIFFFFFAFWFFGIRYRDFLFMAQEYDLFVWDWEYLVESSSRVAGLARYISSFIAQFFYYPQLGAAILAALLSFIQYASEKVFRLRRYGFFLSFLPSALIALQILCVNFFIFEKIDVAYLFSFVSNYAFVLAFMLVYGRIKTTPRRFLYISLGTFLTYPIFGFFSILAAFLCVMLALPEALAKSSETKKTAPPPTDSDKSSRRANNSPLQQLELVVLGVLLTPVPYWLLFSETSPSFQYMYGAGLWEESTLLKGREVSTNLIFVLLQVAVLFLLILFSFSATVRGLKKRAEETPPREASFFCRVFSTICVFLVCVCAVKLSFSTPNFLMFLKIAVALDNKDWDGILEAESRIATPSNPAILARHLALFRQHRLADEIFSRPVYSKASPQLITVGTVGMCGDRMLFEFGIVNGAERVAFNNYVGKNERTYWGLKTLALCAVADGRGALAERYLSRIGKTLFHKRFAEEMLDYLTFVGNRTNTYEIYSKAPGKTPRKRLEEIAAQFLDVKELSPLEDGFQAADNPNSVLYGMLQNEDLSRRDLPEQENRLAFLLLMRHYKEFGKYFDKYALMKNSRRTPRYLQEAALLREQVPSLFATPDVKQWTIPANVAVDPSIRKNFEDYNESKKIRYASKKDDAALKTKYSDTFWFFAATPYAVDNY